MRYALLFPLLFMVAGCGPASTPSDAKLVDQARIDTALKGLVDKGALVGVSALVYEDGKEAYYGAFGMADREANRPMARDTIVQIYSMTKPVTGVALMMLYDEGKFQLDDPLAKYLPEFADTKVYAGLNDKGEPTLVAPERPVSVRDILRHTGGIASGGDEGWVGDEYRRIDPTRRENTLAQMGPLLAKVPLAYQPGARWH